MSERSQVTTHSTAVVPIVPLRPQTGTRPEARPAIDEELEIYAADLEQLVDARASGLRRGADFLAAAAALAVLAPWMALIALAIKLDAPGPVFYTQDRVGINRRRGERRRGSRVSAGRRKIVNAGRPFRIVKFRTMRTDAEAAGPQWARTRDPRVTRVGSFLRKTRLDEVPQFWNVLCGDMTLIGPRPERPFFVNILEAEIPHYSKRLLVKPGITGMAQVNNGYDDSLDSVRKKVKWDLRYIRARGLRTDLAIVLKTIRTVLTGEGAC
jgi:lipopolysaccharide/colanic/teichoic acid biosynthesis glycosyltransferase